MSSLMALSLQFSIRTGCGIVFCENWAPDIFCPFSTFAPSWKGKISGDSRWGVAVPGGTERRVGGLHFPRQGILSIIVERYTSRIPRTPRIPFGAIGTLPVATKIGQ